MCHGYKNKTTITTSYEAAVLLFISYLFTLFVFSSFLFCLSVCYFLLLCLFRNATTVNLESSVSAAKTLTPSAPTWTPATPSMPTSELCAHEQGSFSNPSLISAFMPLRCLVFVAGSYSKVRPLTALCHLDLCHQATQYGCQREDRCHYAHSPLELKTWRVQRHTGESCLRY